MKYIILEDTMYYKHHYVDTIVPSLVHYNRYTNTSTENIKKAFKCSLLQAKIISKILLDNPGHHQIKYPILILE